MSLTAREIQMEFERHRTARRLNDPLIHLMIEQFPAFLAADPEWLERPCNLASLCELQAALLQVCSDNGSYMAMLVQGQDLSRAIWEKGERERPAGWDTFRQRRSKESAEHLRSSLIEPLQRRAEEFLGLTVQQQQDAFLRHGAPPRIAEMLGKGTLTFRHVLQRSPHLLVLAWLVD